MTRLLILTATQVGVAWWTLPHAVHRLAAPAQTGAELAAAATFDALVHQLLMLAVPWLALWLLAVTVLDVSRAARGTSRRSAPRWVRRLVDQGLGALLLVGVMAGPATAQAGLGVLAVPAGRPLTSAPLTPSTELSSPPPEGVGDPAPRPSGAPAAHDVVSQTQGGTSATVSGSGVHEVAAGENLWVIARGQLASAGRATDDRAVHGYWTQLILLNRPVISSGDPDLIQPGEQLLLPALPS